MNFTYIQCSAWKQSRRFRNKLRFRLCAQDIYEGESGHLYNKFPQLRNKYAFTTSLTLFLLISHKSIDRHLFRKDALPIMSIKRYQPYNISKQDWRIYYTIKKGWTMIAWVIVFPNIQMVGSEGTNATTLLIRDPWATSYESAM